MARRYRYVSADSHFESPPDMWTHRVRRSIVTGRPVASSCPTAWTPSSRKAGRPRSAAPTSSLASLPRSSARRPRFRQRPGRGIAGRAAEGAGRRRHRRRSALRHRSAQYRHPGPGRVPGHRAGVQRLFYRRVLRAGAGSSHRRRRAAQRRRRRRHRGVEALCGHGIQDGPPAYLSSGKPIPRPRTTASGRRRWIWTCRSRSTRRSRSAPVGATSII